MSIIDLAHANEVVLERAAGRCEIGLPGCQVRVAQVHHKLRGNPRVHDPERMLAVCLPCHDHVHAHPAEAYEKGWLIRRGGR